MEATVFGAEYEQKFSGWDVSNKANYFNGDLNTISMFTGNNPLTAAAYLADANASSTRAAPATSGSMTYVNGGAVDPEPAGGAGRPVVGGERNCKSFTDEFRLSRELFKDNTTPSAPISPTTSRTTTGTWATAT